MTESATPKEELELYCVRCYWDTPESDAGTFETKLFARNDEEAVRRTWQEMKEFNQKYYGTSRYLGNEEYEVAHCYPTDDMEALKRAVNSVMDQVPSEVRAILERGIQAGRGQYNEFSTGYEPPEATKADALDDAMKGLGAPESPGLKA